MDKTGARYLADGYLGLACPLTARHARHLEASPRALGAVPGWRRTWRRLKIAFSAVVFCLSVSFIPIYNKKVFAGGSGLKRFPYPLTIAFLQLGLVSACLAFASTVAHVLLPPLSQDDGPPLQRSWLFGPFFWYKVCHTAPAGLCFGLKYAVTNWGLQLVPIGTHLLLQATDLLWTIALARVINGERISLEEAICACLATAGTLMISMDATEALSAPLIPILVNLLTPLFLGLSVTTLRWGVKELMRPRGPLGGTMAVAEFTSIKLAISALTCLLCACVFESGCIGLSRHTGLHYSHKPPWWAALAAYPPQGTGLILLAGVLILVFQVNITWLTRLTSAVTVGMVGSIKVMPQWLLNDAFGLGRSLTPLSGVGALLVLASSCLYLHAQLKQSSGQAAQPHVGILFCGGGGGVDTAPARVEPCARWGRFASK